MTGSNGGSITVKNLILFVVLFTMCVSMYILFSNISLPPHVQLKASNKWEPYRHRQLRDKAWFDATCLQGTTPPSALEEVPAILPTWKQAKDSECRKFYNMFTSMFTVTQQDGEVVISDTFAKKVKKWLGNKEDLFTEAHHQKVIGFYNEYTREQNMYNPIRSKRPMSVPQQPEREYVEELNAKTKVDCDFCNFKHFTAEDIFGRIERKWSYSASNTFKLDRWHALFLLKDHHPLNWTKEQFMDLMQTRQDWFDKVYKQDKSYRYPALIWDLLPHAGASQVHPHIHGFLDRNTYQGSMEAWRRAAVDYNEDFQNQNYFSDFVQIHALFGLTVSYGKAVVVANMVPKRDHEVIVIAEKADDDFHTLWYAVLRGYLDVMNKLCFSAGVAFPSMGGEVGASSLPVFGRMVTRGAVAEIRSDISSLELFAASNANTDPFEVIKYMRQSVKNQNTASSAR